MPTVRYFDEFERRLAEWETKPDKERGPKPRLPDKKLDITVTYPDEWLMGHVDLFWQGMEQAPAGAAPSTREIYGTVALCSKIDGLDFSKLAEMPLSYRRFFDWLVKTVYIDGYLDAITVPNE